MKTPLFAALACLLAAQAGAQTYEQKIQNALRKVGEGAAQGPFQPNWKSLESYHVPQWYLDAKFGIFIHWGVYSVPAFGSEWYPRDMYIQGDKTFQHHIATYGPQSKFGYKDFIPMFKAEKFNADAWAELFRKAGAKFVVPVAEHHDGFPMYDCSFTDWSAAKMGPKQDILGELEKAIRKQGLHFGASSHRAEHWWFYEGGMKFDSDVRDKRYFGFYGPAQPRQIPGVDHENQPNEAYLNDWLSRTSEIVDKYHPDLVWFDWWIGQPAFRPYLQRFAAFYYNRGREWSPEGVAINYKNKAFPDGTAVLDIERGKLDQTRSLFWQTDTSVSTKSWGYIKNDSFRTPGSLIDDLVDITSKNGALLLNVGPKSDGTFPPEVTRILLEIGKWLAVNGEAIYGTRPWTVYGEGPTKVVAGSFKDTASKPFTGQDIRFTSRATEHGTILYAMTLASPEGGKVTIHSIPESFKVRSVRLLGSRAHLKWSQGSDGVSIQIPGAHPCNYACAFRMLQ